jgi:rSAM/selenodomain-associated transferase 1
VRHLALLARAPSAGGKTRLTIGLPESRATRLREALFLDTLNSARSLGVPVTIFGTPTDLNDELRALATELPVLPQSEGDLGARMHAAFTCLFGQGSRHVVLIGSDLPTLPPSHLGAAFDALEAGTDLVVGPADDGGYYLIGMSRPMPAVFEGIAWGSANVLQTTQASAASAGLRVHEISEWYDVDTAADLARVDSGPEPARHTRRWMATSAERSG